MNVYYPLITSAVAALNENTAEGRRAIYERARVILASQVKESPSITELEIEYERLALEEAIGECEAEATLRSQGSSLSNLVPGADEQEKSSLSPWLPRILSPVSHRARRLSRRIVGAVRDWFGGSSERCC